MPVKVENNIPDWIKGTITSTKSTRKISDLLSALSLKTVCTYAACPNKGECWSSGHMTFMILGSHCTRNCRFCNVEHKTPSAMGLGEAEKKEPENIARVVKEMGIEYAVITSVTRDDLFDKGAGHFIDVINAIKERSPETVIELLIPDMSGEISLLEKIALSGAEVIGHNIEIPEELYNNLRPLADYTRSLEVLSSIKKINPNKVTKTAMIIGMGESKPDVIRTIRDVEKAGVDILYIGQYLSPSKDHHPVSKYYTLEEFESFKNEARDLGFVSVLAGPLVRSSYRAKQTYLEATQFFANQT